LSELSEQQGFSFKRRCKAFQYAFQGIWTLFRSQCHARYQGIAALAAIALGFSLRITAVEWCLVILAISSVLACEAFNTALEFLADRVSTEHHPLIGKAKDVAASAVLIAALGAAAIGAIIFGPKLWALAK
jgi:diacylglycerol kinase (ATP)